MRYSEQREKILLAVKNCCDHPTAEVIYSRVKAQMPDISMGTVYRNLRLLAEMGLVDNGQKPALRRKHGGARSFYLYGLQQNNRCFRQSENSRAVEG